MTKYAEQARTLVAMRAARDSTKIVRDWRDAMISVIAEARTSVGGSSAEIELPGVADPRGWSKSRTP